MLVEEVRDRRRFGPALVIALAWSLGACATATSDDVAAGDDTGGDDDAVDAAAPALEPDAAGPAQTFTVGGTVSGLLAGETITLRNNGGDALTRGPGPFTFATAIASGGPYAVTVSDAPDHACTVSNGTGTVTAPVTSVAVACTSRFLLRESFDAVTAPGLPAGWVEAGPRSFDTVTTAVDTAPLAVFVASVNVVSDSSLTMPAFAVPATGTVTLTFRHQYALESTFDGGVLEISIGGGAFTDVVTAGGAFLAGGYVSTMSSSTSSPIGAQQAWTGVSGVFVSTSVRLPASASGQDVALRWRLATDTSVNNTGWWIDTIAVRVD